MLAWEPGGRRFQSALLRKERLLDHAASQGWCLFQSALLRKERRGAGGAAAGLPPVSIRAPTQGATHFPTIWRERTRFQSALLRKERRVVPRPTVAQALFQSALLRKERQTKLATGIRNLEFQSALLRKERPKPPTPRRRPSRFNPRSYARSDR